MNDDDYGAGFEEEVATPENKPESETITVSSTDGELTAEAEVEVEATAFDDDDAEDRLKGAIGEGDIETDYPDSVSDDVSAEDVAEDSADKTVEEAAAPAEEAAAESPNITPTEETAAEEPVVDESTSEESSSEDTVENIEEQTMDSEPTSSEEPVDEEPVEIPADSILSGDKKADKVETAVPAQNADAATVAAVPKKKSKLGLIIALIAIFVLLVGGGLGFFLWYSNHESAEVSVNDAVAKIMDTKAYTMSGSYSGKRDGKDAQANVEVVAEKDGVSVSVNTNNVDSDGEADNERAANFIFLGNGELYAKGTGLTDSLSDQTNASGMNSQSRELVEAVRDVIAEKVDGKWFKLSDDVIESAGSALKDEIDGLRKFGNDSEMTQKIKDAYKNNEFLEVDKDAKVTESNGAKYYTLKLNKEKFNSFMGVLVPGYDKLLQLLEGVQSLQNTASKCGTNGTKCIDSSDTTANTQSSMLNANDIDKMSIQIGVKPWSHDIAEIRISKNTAGNEKCSVIGVVELTDCTAKIVMKPKVENKPAAPSDVSDEADANKAIKDVIESKMNGILDSLITQSCSDAATLKQLKLTEETCAALIRQQYGTAYSTSIDGTVAKMTVSSIFSELLKKISFGL